MKTAVFKNSLLSYVLSILLGIAAGLAVAFFSRFPSDDLWGLAFFSSRTFGFWIFTCSLIALFSERHFTAGIHTALYVFFMFYVTGVFKHLVIVQKGYQPMSYFWNGLLSNLLYGLLPALACFALAFMLWYGRMTHPFSAVLRWMPAVCIAAEELLSIRFTVIRKQGLFTVLLDAVCLILYIAIMAVQMKKHRSVQVS